MVASQNVFTKQNIGIVAAVLVLVAAFFVPGTEVLDVYKRQVGKGPSG